MSVYKYNRLSIRDGGDYASVRVWELAEPRIESLEQEVPPERRQEAAQQLAGEGYRVVPTHTYDTDHDGWENTGRREAIRQAEQFHAGLMKAHRENETLRAEVVKLREHRDELRQRISDQAHARLYEAEAAQPDRPEPVDPASMAAAKADALREFASGLDSEFDHIKVALCNAADRFERPEPDPQVVAALIPIVQKVCMVEPHHAEQFARDLARHDVYVEVPNA